MIQKPTFSSIPVQLDQAAPCETKDLSPYEDTLKVAETRRADGVESGGFSKNENQLKEEALRNAVIEIEALIMTAAQTSTEHSEQGRGVRSEIEVLRQTQKQRIEDAFNGRRSTQEESGPTRGLEEGLPGTEWEYSHSTEETPRHGDDLSQRDRSAESCQGETDFGPVPNEIPGTGLDLQSDNLAGMLSLQPAKTGIGTFSEGLDTPADIIRRLNSENSSERSLGLSDLARIGGENAFHIIARAFDDHSEDVRNAAARALFDLQPDRVASFVRTLREASPDRRRRIGASIAGSGLAGIAIGNLAGQTRDQGYEAFSLLFLMTKAGEVQPLVRAVEDHPNIEVRLAVVRLLALNGQPEIVPSFRQLAVRGVLPSEVRTAVIEAIYELGRQIP